MRKSLSKFSIIFLLIFLSLFIKLSFAANYGACSITKCGYYSGASSLCTPLNHICAEGRACLGGNMCGVQTVSCVVGYCDTCGECGGIVATCDTLNCGFQTTGCTGSSVCNGQGSTEDYCVAIGGVGSTCYCNAMCISNNCVSNLCASSDTTSPMYSNIFSNITNNTAVNVGTPISLGAQWNDVALSMYVNSTKINNSGSWTNGTWQSFASGNWSNFTVIFPSQQDSNLTVKIYANDTSNNQNVTGTWFWWNATAADATSPTYSSNSTNSTLAGTPILHSLNWTDNSALSGYIFSFDNCTGSLVNDTWTAFSGTWSNVTKTSNSTASCTIRWCVYANDTTNNWNGTSCASPFTYTTTSAGTFISISISSALINGVMFGTINPNTNDNPALNNSNGQSGGTAYNITIDSSTTVNVDLYHDATGNLVSGSNVIVIGNLTHQANTTSNIGNNLAAAGSTVLSMTYSIIGSICQNLAASSNCWISYWLDTPTAQPPGNYNTTYEYCAVQNGAGYSQCG